MGSLSWNMQARTEDSFGASFILILQLTPKKHDWRMGEAGKTEATEGVTGTARGPGKRHSSGNTLSPFERCC